MPCQFNNDELEQLRSFDLPDLCHNIQQENEGRKLELSKFLVNVYKNLSVNNNNPFHLLLTDYPWRKIYTLNIDDLVENIYHTNGVKIIIQNQTNRVQCKLKEIQLIKLHGCVNQPELGFIFSTEEYEDTILNANFKLRQFCNDYYDNDVIFLGTEFNERDISILLKKYLSAGYRSNNCNYFFISPSVKIKLKTTINSIPNAYHISWSAEKFLNVCSELGMRNERKERLEKNIKQYKYWYIGDYTKIPTHFESRLYYGKSPIWYDILDNWDFALSNTVKTINDFISKEIDCIITIVGKAFVGKSVLAKRFAVEFFKKGYEAFEYDCQGEDELQLFTDYITEFPAGSKIAVIVEDAAMQYRNLAELLRSKPSHLGHIVIIAVSRTRYHSIKRYELLNCEKKEIYIDGAINYKLANEIVHKLDDKNRLGELNKYAEGSKKQYEFVKNKGNLIDFLYYFTHGRGFQEYFLQKYLEVFINNEYYELFNSACIFSVMGIDYYPHEMITGLYKQVVKQNFLRRMDDLIDEYGNLGDIKIRCAEIFEQNMITRLNSKEKSDILLKNIMYLSSLFDEDTNNQWSGFFERLIKTKILKKVLKIDDKDISNVFDEIETKYNKISYYWMQRGIFAQSLSDFENAELFLNQAKGIRPSSYQIQHALAKNKMERALYELEKGYASAAPYYFEEGEKEILWLINSPHYSNALCYSVNTYIDMKLKYCTLSNQPFDKNIGESLYEYLIWAARVNYDPYIKNSRKTLLQYCIKNDLTELCDKLSPENFIEYIRNEYDDYDVIDWD